MCTRRVEVAIQEANYGFCAGCSAVNKSEARRFNMSWEVYSNGLFQNYDFIYSLNSDHDWGLSIHYSLANCQSSAASVPQCDEAALPKKASLTQHTAHR